MVLTGAKELWRKGKTAEGRARAALGIVRGEPMAYPGTRKGKSVVVNTR